MLKLPGLAYPVVTPAGATGVPKFSIGSQGTGFWNSGGGAKLVFCVDTYDMFAIDRATGQPNRIQQRSDGGYTFMSNDNVSGGTPDAGIRRPAARVVEVSDGQSAGGILALQEGATPAGVADKAYIYAVDVAGKTALRVIFGSGAAITLAIEV